MKLVIFLSLLAVVVHSLTETESLESKADPNGYLFFCLCMGRFGNQAEHFLGGLAFAKSINRTLILPPWRTYKNVEFSEWFQVEPLTHYHRVISAEDFMRDLAPTVWPQEKRYGFCFQFSHQGVLCEVKQGIPDCWPWVQTVSKSTGLVYCFNTETGTSFYPPSLDGKPAKMEKPKTPPRASEQKTAENPRHVANYDPKAIAKDPRVKAKPRESRSHKEKDTRPARARKSVEQPNYRKRASDRDRESEKHEPREKSRRSPHSTPKSHKRESQRNSEFEPMDVGMPEGPDVKKFVFRIPKIQNVAVVSSSGPPQIKDKEEPMEVDSVEDVRHLRHNFSISDNRTVSYLEDERLTQIDSTKITPTGTLVLVVDTNVLLDDLDKLKVLQKPHNYPPGIILRDAHVNSVVRVIPFIVLQELDKLKDSTRGQARNKSLNEKAYRAIKYIGDELDKNRDEEMIICEPFTSHRAPVFGLTPTSNDQYVAKCALNIQMMVTNGCEQSRTNAVSLLTNDRLLLIQATKSFGVQYAYTPKNFQEMFTVLPRRQVVSTKIEHSLVLTPVVSSTTQLYQNRPFDRPSSGFHSTAQVPQVITTQDRRPVIYDDVFFDSNSEHSHTVISSSSGDSSHGQSTSPQVAEKLKSALDLCVKTLWKIVQVEMSSLHGEKWRDHLAKPILFEPNLEEILYLILRHLDMFKRLYRNGGYFIKCLHDVKHELTTIDMSNVNSLKENILQPLADNFLRPLRRDRPKNYESYKNEVESAIHLVNSAIGSLLQSRVRR